MKTRFFFMVAFFMGVVSFLWPAFANSQETPTTHGCITDLGIGKIYWSSGKVTATGKASPQGNKEGAQEAVPGAARADASRNIIEILKQIKICSTQNVGEYASQNDVILAGIENTARDAVITQQYYTSALDVEITLETSILGGFLQLVLPEEIRQISKISEEKPGKTEQKPVTGMGNIPYTGLIIDARGLGLEPVLYPIVVSEQGSDIYSSLFISREFAVQSGVCAYVCTLEEAVQEKRIGSHPLIIKGLRKSSNENTSIVISMADTKLVEKATERHLFLKECRVIIVLGR